ncbi:MAG TPA: GntR family transcriptional regulator [Rhizomicrobium sp.]|jgi:DNA-binding GntR family transcriptional regulator|nr:GntR family transcriptional regulator [Rhizomicrobium sp.]
MSQPVGDDRDISKTDRVYTVLRRRIRDLTLAPGAPLRKEEIAFELGVSRAPVSEAIARLAEEGLIDVFPQHGSFVALIRAADLRESLFVRTALEVEAMRRLAQVVDAATLERLDENLASQARALDAGNLEEFYDLDEALHAAIFGAIAAPHALRLLEAARAPLDRVRRLALPIAGRPEQTLAEHRALVEAIRSRDAEYAAAAMRAHLAMVARAIEQKLPEIEATRG